MGSSHAVWILFVAISVCIAPLCNGIQCYFCTASTDSRCHTAYFPYQSESEQPIDCTQSLVDSTLNRIKGDLISPGEELGSFDCLKAEVKIAFNRTELIRGCANGQTKRFDPCSDLRRQFTNPSDLFHCSVCKTDACNSSKIIAPLYFLVFICAVTVKFSGKLF